MQSSLDPGNLTQESLAYMSFADSATPSDDSASRNWTTASVDPYDPDGRVGGVADTWRDSQKQGYYGNNNGGMSDRRNPTEDLMLSRQQDLFQSRQDVAPGVSAHMDATYAKQPLAPQQPPQNYDSIENKWRFGAYDGSGAYFPGYQHYRDDTQGYNAAGAVTRSHSNSVNFNNWWLEQKQAKQGAKEYIKDFTGMSALCQHKVNKTHAGVKVVAFSSFAAALLIYSRSSKKEIAVGTALAALLGTALAMTPSTDV